MATAWLDERNASTLFLARGAGRPLWIGTAGKELFFASTRAALDLLEQTVRLTLRKRELDEGTLLRDRGRARHRPRPLPGRPLLRRGDDPSRRPRPARGRLVPQAPRRDRARDRLERLPERAVGRDLHALVAQPLAHEVLERRPGRLDVDHPVDLPLGQQRRVGTASRGPVGHLRQPAERPGRAPHPARPRARAAPPPPARRSRPRAAPARASRTCARAATSRASRPCGHRCRARSACARAPRRARAAGPSSSSLVAKRRGTSPACRLAAFQLPKCSITVCGCTVVCGVRGELAHRRRASKPLGARRQLSEDLLVRVALADAGLERCKCFRIDACHRRVAARSSHANSLEHFLQVARTLERTCPA